MTDKTYGPYPAKITDEHDGDTVKATVVHPNKTDDPNGVDLGWGVWLFPDRIEIHVVGRTFGDNARELNTDQGKKDLAYLQSIMPVGTSVSLLSHGWDKFSGRTDVSLTLPDGTDLVKRMIDSGHAVAWDGQGTKPT